MISLQDYFQRARDNQEVFRNILRDLRVAKEIRPQGQYIPQDLNPEAELEKIFDNYSLGNRHGKFTILDFTRPNSEAATIAYENIYVGSGGGALLTYAVGDDNSISLRGQRSWTR